MVDPFNPEQRSWIMRQVKSKNTLPERTVRSMVHGMGYRFRLHRKDLPGNPDIVFPARKKIIFVNGCFWHGHACKRAKLPTTRHDYWALKISRTKDRDINNTKALRRLGWKSLVLWECQLKEISRVEARIKKFLG